MVRIPGFTGRAGRGLVAAVLCAALASCGPGGGNNLAIPTPFGGLVKVPSGSPPLAKPTLLARVEAFLAPRALALTGVDVVGAGVPVTLYAIDAAGNPYGRVLDQSITASDGSYSVTLPSWNLYDPAHPWVVAVGDAAAGTLMRRLVDDLAATGAVRDIDPASEATLRLLLEDPVQNPFRELDPGEIAELNDQVAAAAANVSGLTIDEMVTAALRAARDDEPTQRRLIAITSTPENTRPLARAGIDFRMTTGDTLNLLGNAEDADGDLVSYRWTVEEAPAGSAIPRVPPVGRLFSFSADVDGTYLLKLVVTDINLASSPPDYSTIIATTPPVRLTDNTVADSEGEMTRARDLLVYTTAVRDAASNTNYADVLIQQIDDTGAVGDPLPLLPPGATRASDVARTVEGHPGISADGTLAVFSTDIVSPGTGGGDFDVVAVPIARPGPAIRVTTSTAFDTQPDVQCATPTNCVVVYVNDADPAGSQVHAVTYTDNGIGFVETGRVQLTTDPTDHFGPVLSEDGQWVVYVARDLSGGDLELYRARTDGSTPAPERLTDNDVNDDQPEPDFACDRVVFRRGNAVMLLHTDGSGVDRLSDAQIRASHPSISATGSLVAFVGETDLGTDLFTVRSDGSLLTQLTTDGSVSQPRASFEGTRVLFRSARDGDHDFFLR
jgi:Tol biopolymer transport system component